MVMTAVIGNSHAIAIKQAMEIKKENSIKLDVDANLESPLGVIEFYFIDSLWEIDQKKSGNDCGRLYAVPKQEDDSGLSLDEFDNVILCAGGWWAARNNFVTRNPPSHPLGYMACADWNYTPSQTPASVRLVSAAMFKAAVEDWIRDQPIVQLAKYLVASCDHRIFLQPWPAPSRALKDKNDWVLNSLYREYGARAWLDYFTA